MREDNRGEEDHRQADQDEADRDVDEEHPPPAGPVGLQPAGDHSHRRRDSDFQRRLGIATNVLKSRLDGFVDAGIMRRHQYSERPELYEYLLTDKGRDLARALIALTEWGDRWASPDGPPILYTHSVCGSALSQAVLCDTCGRVDEPAEVQIRPGPGMPPDRAALFTDVDV